MSKWLCIAALSPSGLVFWYFHVRSSILLKFFTWFWEVQIILCTIIGIVLQQVNEEVLLCVDCRAGNSPETLQLKCVQAYRSTHRARLSKQARMPDRWITLNKWQVSALRKQSRARRLLRGARNVPCLCCYIIYLSSKCNACFNCSTRYSLQHCGLNLNFVLCTQLSILIWLRFHSK